MMLLRSAALPAVGCRGSSKLSSSARVAARPRVPAARDASRIIRGASGAREELKAAAPAPATEDEPSLFFEPLVRGFFLGVGAGVLTEFAHVALKVSDFVAAAESLESLPGLLPQVFPELAPLVALDNVAALSSWCFFYLIEVAAIIAILRDHPNDDSVAKKAISSKVTLPKALMPISLSSVKLHMYRLLHSGRFPAGAATAPQSLGAGSGGASDAVSLGSAEPLAFLPDGPLAGMPPMPPPGARAGVGRGGAGTAVLERPSAFPPSPVPQQFPDEEEEEEEEGTQQQQQEGTATPSGKDSTATAAPPEIAPSRTVPRPEAAANAGPAKTQRKPSYGVPAEKRGALRPGEWDPALRASELRRTKELADRRSYLNNFWYAAALSQDVLPGKVKEVQMLGRTVALFRDAETGTVRALDNVCPHRGAPLGKGWAKQVKGHGTCVVCPYHGWAFDKEGRLAEVPSSPAGTAFPKRPLVDAYPLQEQGGFVWLFFGAPSLPADERPPIPMIPELSDPNLRSTWRAVYGEIEFNCPHWGVFENAIDMAHIHYLHGDSFGNSEKPVIEGMAVERSTFSVTSSFNIHNKPVSPLWDWTAVDSVPVTATAFLPSTSAVKIQLGACVSMITFVNTVPIDANRSINRFCLVRNFAGWDGFDTWARNAMYRILGEDKVMVEKLTPEALRREVSLDADKPQIAFRKLRQEWIDMGYGVDPALTSGHHGSLSVDM